jgi:hypothetical protein
MFETHDMAFASYLVTRGHSIAEVKRSGRRVFWQFSITAEELSQAESSWPSTPECTFFNLYQTLKNQIRN